MQATIELRTKVRIECLTPGCRVTERAQAAAATSGEWLTAVTRRTTEAASQQYQRFAGGPLAVRACCHPGRGPKLLWIAYTSASKGP